MAMSFFSPNPFPVRKMPFEPTTSGSYADGVSKLIDTKVAKKIEQNFDKVFEPDTTLEGTVNEIVKKVILENATMTEKERVEKSSELYQFIMESTMTC